MSPETVASRYVLKSLREASRVAAMILRHCPEFITKARPDETVDQYLRRIGHGTLDGDAVEAITGVARVNGSWRIRSLKVSQRMSLAKELDRFAGELGQ